MRRASATVEERKKLRLFKEMEYTGPIPLIFYFKRLKWMVVSLKESLSLSFSFKEPGILYYMLSKFILEVLLKLICHQKALCNWRDLKIKEDELHHNGLYS